MNPKTRPTRREHESTETPVVETPASDQKVVEATDETQGQEGVEVTDDQGDRRKRKGKVDTEEVKKEDLLERPENALSYAEYKEQLKQKNQGISSNTNKQQQVNRTVESDLTPQDKKEDLTLGITDTKKTAQKPKIKERKVDSKEVELNQVFSNNLKLDDGRDNNYNNNNNRNTGAKKNWNNNNSNNKFKFNANDFPEL